jgi:hypothetical protein
MKINLLVVVLGGMVLAAALCGCSNPASDPPTPPPPDPVKVYLTGTDTLTCVNAAGTTIPITAFYQLDTNADGTVDIPAKYYTGADIPVVFNSDDGFNWTITVGTPTYVNTKWLSGRTSFVASDANPTGKRYYDNHNDTYVWMLVDAGTVVWAARQGSTINATPYPTFTTFHTTGAGSICDADGTNFYFWQD